MKLLYIGHYKENSGWSNAAINAIKAINTTSIDVVCRNLKLTNRASDVDDIIETLEQKSTDNIDYCIQHVLPHHITGTDKFKKNIAYFVHELDSIKYHHWYHNLELVDEIWVPNNNSKTNLISDGFDNKKIKVIPHTFDIETYNDINQRIKFSNRDHTFKFYFICELDDRKNLESIIRCFHSEFHATEPVSLVLKVKKSGLHPDSVREKIINLCNNIKSSMRLYPSVEDYNSEIIITENFTAEEMKVLHLSCDCYIGTTHGEGWGIPAFEAMCYGKTPICSNEGGPKEFIDENNKNTGYLVNGIQQICNHNNAAFNDIFTGKNHWFVPSEIETKKAMRYYYNLNISNEEKRKCGIEQAQKFSYKNVGQMIKESLND